MPIWKNTFCIRKDGGPWCGCPERHPDGQPMFPSVDAAREALEATHRGVAGPFPCHKCLMAARLGNEAVA